MPLRMRPAQSAFFEGCESMTAAPGALPLCVGGRFLCASFKVMGSPVQRVSTFDPRDLPESSVDSPGNFRSLYICSAPARLLRRLSVRGPPPKHMLWPPHL